MKHINKHLSIRKVALLSVLFFAISCKKDDNTIGAELFDEQEGVTTTDTLSFISYTVKQDSIPSKNISLSLLGSYNDPVFGITSNDIYTHARISADNVDFAPSGTSADIVLDSVILTLSYSSFYGTLEAQNFEVFEVTDAISNDSIYYSNKSFATTGVNIVDPASALQTPNLTDSVTIDGTKVEPLLKLKLDNAFGQKIINESGTTNLANNDNFLQFIKGLKITTNNSFPAGQGAILSMNLLSENSKVTLYYHNTVTADTNQFDLLINTSSTRVNTVTHDYTGTAIETQLNDSTLGVNETYLQGVQGLKTYVDFPTLTNLKDSNVIVNKAVLSFPVDFSGGDYTPNSQLLVLRQENGNLLVTPDQITFGFAGVGGAYDEDNKVYNFTITRYINNVINGTYENNPLVIESASSLVVPNRAVLFGTGSASKPKITLSYTKY